MENTNEIKKCESCENEHNGTYGSGRFCSKSCASHFSTKAKRKEINEKISKKLKGSGNGVVTKECINCKKEFVVNYSKRHKQYCNIDCKLTCYIYKQKLSNIKKQNLTEERLEHLRKISKLGGFGKNGYTNKGIFYQSTFEKLAFEYLSENNIEFEAHKYLLSSSFVSDIYLIDYDLYIELDGINREKKKQWLNSSYDNWVRKIAFYNENKMKYEIFLNIKQFINFINIKYNII